MTPALLRNAADALGHASAVIGPAEDGGYWLFGLARAVPAVFEDIDVEHGCGLHANTGAAGCSRNRPGAPSRTRRLRPTGGSGPLARADPGVSATVALVIPTLDEATHLAAPRPPARRAGSTA